MADKHPSLAKKLLRDQRTLLAIVIVAIVVIVSFINPKFIGIGNIITIFQQISVLGILTMAMSMLLISGGIDLSIGNIMVQARAAGCVGSLQQMRDMIAKVVETETFTPQDTAAWNEAYYKIKHLLK